METLDVVNDFDEVIKTATKEDVYAFLLPHRVVHILIFNEMGELALQLRSRFKTFCPSHWSTTVGGHVQAGETYEQAAKREMKEELGIDLPLEFIRKYLYEDERKIKKFIVTFKAFSNGPFKMNPEEVEKVKFFDLDEIKWMLKCNEKFHPELLFLLEKIYGIKK